MDQEMWSLVKNKIHILLFPLHLFARRNRASGTRSDVKKSTAHCTKVPRWLQVLK